MNKDSKHNNDKEVEKKEGPIKKIEDLFNQNNDNIKSFFNELDKAEGKNIEEE